MAHFCAAATGPTGRFLWSIIPPPLTERDWPPLVSPLRVYFVPPKTAVNDRDGSGDRLFEPDALTPGLGPAVKLLHAVLQRIVELDARTARSFLGRWRHSDIAVYRRLWAAAARNADAVSAAEAGEFLTGLDDAEFWDVWPFPEFAELRATRFKDFEPETQALILRRLRRGLPRRYFPRNMDAEEIRTKRRALAAMEFRRIEIGGGTLPVQDRDRVLEATDDFPGLGKWRSTAVSAIHGSCPISRPAAFQSLALTIWEAKPGCGHSKTRCQARRLTIKLRTGSDSPITLSISWTILKAQLRWWTASRASGIVSGMYIPIPGCIPRAKRCAMSRPRRSASSA